MKWLLDTNILLRWVQPTQSLHAKTVQILDGLHARGEQFFLTAQNIVEFWAVATRPVASNGLGMSVVKTNEEIEALENLFPLLPDTVDVYFEWRRLVATYGVRGMLVYDARLIAVMLVHRVSHLLTFNTRDFTRYPEVIAVDPTEI